MRRRGSRWAVYRARATDRWTLRFFWLVTLVVAYGCGGEQPASSPPEAESRRATSGGSSPRNATLDQPPIQGTPAVSPPIAVGDDLTASLSRVAEAVKAAVAGFNKVEKLIYPPGWSRRQTAVLAIESKLEDDGSSGSAKGVIRLSIQDCFSLIRATLDEATHDDELFPRKPARSREEMFRDQSNPEQKPVELTLHYEVHDGHWRRTRWEAPDKLARGADWLDAIGAP